MLWERGNNYKKIEQARSSSGDLVDEQKHISLQSGRDVAACGVAQGLSTATGVAPRNAARSWKPLSSSRNVLKRQAWETAQDRSFPVPATQPRLEGEARRGFAGKCYSVCGCFNWQPNFSWECRVQFDEG